MSRISILSVAFALFCGIGCVSAAQEEDQALAQYKAYLVALRAGKAGEILKMSVPVSGPVKQIQLESIRARILMERLRRETVAQFGAMKIDTKNDDPWLGIGEPWDEYLGDVGYEKSGAAIVVQIPHPDPALRGLPGQHLHIAFFIRRNGKWLLPMGLDMNFEDPEEHGLFNEPEPEQREGRLNHFQIVNKALEAVLKRLAAKEFKNSADVIKALQAEIPAGERLLHY